MLSYKLKIDDFAWPVFIIFLITKAFAGPLAIILPLIRFMPVVLMIILIAYKFSVLFTSNIKILIMGSFVGLYLFIGMINKSLISSLFGLYVFIPFFYSFLFSKEIVNKIINEDYKFSTFLFITCAIGVLYVDTFGASWIGMEQEVGGITKEISKAWSSNGVMRNPGFTSGSVSAAGIMLIVTAQIGRYLSIRGKVIPYCLLFVVSFYVIYLTTTKTMIFSLVIVMVLLYMPFNVVRWVVKLSVLATCLFSYYYMFGDKPLGYAQFDNTLLIRMYSTWPDAISILDDNISFLFGKGFGSIGTPSYYFPSKISSPADNLYVYLYVIFGLVSVIVMSILILKLLVKKKFHTLDDKLFYIIVVIIFSGAVTYNMIESSIYSIYGGVIIGCIFFNRENIDCVDKVD